jgi:hypothetical protein
MAGCLLITTALNAQQPGAEQMIPAQAIQPFSGFPVVQVRHEGRQAQMTPAKREVRFIPSTAETFADVIKAELVSAAIRVGADMAQEQIYRTLSGNLNKVGRHLPYATGEMVGRVSSRIPAFGRRNKQRGFEFDYLSGIRSAIEFNTDNPVEFIVASATPFASVQPVLMKAEVLSKEAIRVISSRKLEIREAKGAAAPSYERAVLKVEKNTPLLQILKQPDGSLLVMPSAPLEAGEYTLAFLAGDKDGSTVLDHVFDFRVNK